MKPWRRKGRQNPSKVTPRTPRHPGSQDPLFPSSLSQTQLPGKLNSIPAPSTTSTPAVESTEIFPKLCPIPAFEAGSFYPDTPTKKTRTSLWGRNSRNRPKTRHSSSRNFPGIPLPEQQSLRNKRERQQQAPDTIGQNKPCHSRSEFPKKKSPNSRQNVARKEEKRFYLPSSVKAKRKTKLSTLLLTPSRAPCPAAKATPNPKSGKKKEGREGIRQLLGNPTLG